MSNFSFLSQKSEYTLFATACTKAKTFKHLQLTH